MVLEFIITIEALLKFMIISLTLFFLNISSIHYKLTLVKNTHDQAIFMDAIIQDIQTRKVLLKLAQYIKNFKEITFLCKYPIHNKL